MDLSEGRRFIGPSQFLSGHCNDKSLTVGRDVVIDTATSTHRCEGPGSNTGTGLPHVNVGSRVISTTQSCPSSS